MAGGVVPGEEHEGDHIWSFHHHHHSTFFHVVQNTSHTWVEAPPLGTRRRRRRRLPSPRERKRWKSSRTLCARRDESSSSSSRSRYASVSINRFPFDTQKNALRSFVRSCVCNRLSFSPHIKCSRSFLALSTQTALEPPPQIHRWTQDARLYFLKFPTPVSQKMALGRASVFLEDVDLHGQIVHSIPSGQSGGAANYSGHNMRVNSFCLFLNRCKEEKKELKKL